MYRWGVELTPNQRRVPVTEAADALSISEGAVRMRVKRGTLPSTREGGRLYVLLNTEPTPEPGRPHVRTHDRTSELIATLREQLQAERQAHSEARRLLAAALERIPAIEVPQETSEATEAAEEQQGRGTSPTPLREGLRGGRTEAVVAQAHTEVTERCKKSAKSAQRRWPKN
jgi:hypothetical protein